MECPICFTAYDRAEHRPVRTFCRCRQTLCRDCLTQLLAHFTNCPWDRMRWSGRNLIQKFEESTPEHYLEQLEQLAKDHPVSLHGESNNLAVSRQDDDTDEVQVQTLLLQRIEVMKLDRELALKLAKELDQQVVEPPRKRPKVDLLGFLKERFIVQLQQSPARPSTPQIPPCISSSHSSGSSSSNSNSNSSTSDAKAKGKRSLDILAALHAQPERWACAQCSFSNFPLLPTCEMCEADKPTPQRSSAGFIVEIE